MIIALRLLLRYYILFFQSVRLKGLFLSSLIFFGLVHQTYGQEHKIRKSLSVCLLDLDMPLSKKSMDTVSMLPGFYYELGQMIAAKLSSEFHPYYTMAAFHKRPAREGLLAGNCEIQFGMPYAEGPHYLEGQVELTKPFIEMGYALVVSPKVKIESYLDLAGLKVAVLTGSPPQMALSAITGVKMVYCTFSEHALEKLSRGEVDAAFVWGPEAGYLNKFYYQDKFMVIPTTYEWPVAIGTSYADTDLRNQINRLIGSMNKQIKELKYKYGFPMGARLEMPGFRYDFKD